MKTHPLELATNSGRIRIPSLPTSLRKLQELLASDEAGVAEVAELLVLDPPLSAETLRIANSVLYGARTKILSVQSAATILGMNTLSSIVTRAGVMSAFDHVPEHQSFRRDSFWKHSILVAHTVSELATRCRRRATDLSAQDFYACGLLHDIGKIILYDNFGEQYLQVMSDSQGGNDFAAEEAKFLGLNHSDVGGLSASMWHLPEPIPDLLKHHHDPTQCPMEWRDLCSMVACADQIAYEVERHAGRDAKQLAKSVRTVPLGATPKILEAVVESSLRHIQSIEV